jgi:sulfoxide reductase heme-binding subunit YedZ
MTLTLPIASSTALWFLTRGTGVVALLLLTLVIVLGVMNVRRTQLKGVPRFVLELVHRNAALLAVAFLAIHILTAVLDPFAPISLVDAVVPFHSAYRPFWLGLGALASDLLLAVVITSLARRRLGYGAWRAVHWLAYASWPVAILHGLGTGTDPRARWMLALTGLCVAAVTAAVAIRVASGWPHRIVLRLGALSACAAVPIGLAAWLPSGPLAANWARRAGTPAAVLAKAHAGYRLTASAGTSTSSSAAPSSAGSAGSAAPSSAGASAPGSRPTATSFQAPVGGSVSQSLGGGGQATIILRLHIAGERLSRLAVLLRGEAIEDGGVSMTASSVTLGTAAQPVLYRGSIDSLDGGDIQASVTGPGGRTIDLAIDLELAGGATSAAGTVTASS